MIIERTSSEIIIRIPSFVKTDGVEQLVDYLSYSEATSKSKAIQSEIDLIAKDAKKGWWNNNKTRLLK